jgi:hypothetical protein
MTAIGGAPMPDGAVSGSKTVTLNGEGEVEFGDITFTRPGTYVYVISEVAPPGSGIASDIDEWYEYDDTVFTLTIIIEDDGSKLYIASRTFTSSDNKPLEKAEFVNVYNKLIDKEIPQPPNPPIKPDPEDNENKPGEKLELRGEKTWLHGGNPNPPASIIIFVKADGEIIIQKEVTARDNWKWNFSLNKFDKNGREISYSVDEQQIPGYEKQLTEKGITNSWTGSKIPDPATPGAPGGSQGGKGSKPKTGDDHRLLNAFILMDIAVLALMLLARRRLSKGGKG